MVLAVDIGNTNIVCGILKDDEIISTFRLTTENSMTSDEYGVMICNIIERRGVALTDIQAVIVASVVPQIMYSFSNAIVKYFNITPMVVGPGIKTGIRLANENPKEMGADRIADAVAAYQLYGGPVIVVDYGTATTYDVILADGTFSVGVTAPGIISSAKTLWQNTAKLPEIEIKKPETILAKNTIESMQAGLVYGQIGQTEYIIKTIKSELGINDIKVVATGGLGKLISESTDVIDEYDAYLTLKGLNIIYKKNVK
ncbi:MAG: type III pantothenate kinase [Lachnospiraceae bacterium]|nr:type III pantothenate kinase [Lachnospiraceae bacterium]